jgi:hypothetical protein
MRMRGTRISPASPDGGCAKSQSCVVIIDGSGRGGVRRWKTMMQSCGMSRVPEPGLANRIKCQSRIRNETDNKSGFKNRRGKESYNVMTMIFPAPHPNSPNPAGESRTQRYTLKYLPRTTYLQSSTTTLSPSDTGRNLTRKAAVPGGGKGGHREQDPGRRPRQDSARPG